MEQPDSYSSGQQTHNYRGDQLRYDRFPATNSYSSQMASRGSRYQRIPHSMIDMNSYGGYADDLSQPPPSYGAPPMPYQSQPQYMVGRHSAFGPQFADPSASYYPQYTDMRRYPQNAEQSRSYGKDYSSMPLHLSQHMAYEAQSMNCMTSSHPFGPPPTRLREEPFGLPFEPSFGESGTYDSEPQYETVRAAPRPAEKRTLHVWEHAAAVAHQEQSHIRRDLPGERQEVLNETTAADAPDLEDAPPLALLAAAALDDHKSSTRRKRRREEASRGHTTSAEAYMTHTMNTHGGGLDDSMLMPEEIESGALESQLIPSAPRYAQRFLPGPGKKAKGHKRKETRRASDRSVLNTDKYEEKKPENEDDEVNTDEKPAKKSKDNSGCSEGWIDYQCSYCGSIKTSTSAGADGRVRIRCECGGKHRDNRPRMHAM